MKVALIYNPKAGRHSQRRVRALQDFLTNHHHRVCVFDCHDFHNRPDASDLDCLCIVGGDGTLRHVLNNAINETEQVPSVCVVPTGTINLVARELHHSENLSSALQRIESHPKTGTMVTLACFNEDKFLACASIGADSIAVARLRDPLKQRLGRLAYIVSFIGLLFHWQRPHLTILADGVRYEAEAAFVLNGRYYAGPWSLDPLSRLACSELRLLLLPKGRRWDYLRLAIYAVFNARWPDPQWQFLAVQSVEIKSDHTWPVQADGDIVGQTPARFSLSDKALNFL